MMEINILVEGQTEEAFVKEILSTYLRNYNIYIKPIIVSTKRIKEGGKFRGGLSNGNFASFLKDLKKLIYSTPQGYVTTFIDYYKIPSKFPGYHERETQRTQLDKVLFLEKKLCEFLGTPKNFIPYIQLHEFEAFHFSDKAGFEKCLTPEEADLGKLVEIINVYDNPEDIN